MALIEEAIWSRVTTNAAVTALIATRMFPELNPQAATFPLIVYSTQGGQHMRYSGGVTGLASADFEFECWDTTDSGAKALCDALRKALDGLTAVTVLGLRIRRVALERASDTIEYAIGPEQRRAFAATQNSSVWYSEATS